MKTRRLVTPPPPQSNSRSKSIWILLAIDVLLVVILFALLFLSTKATEPNVRGNDEDGAENDQPVYVINTGQEEPKSSFQNYVVGASVMMTAGALAYAKWEKDKIEGNNNTKEQEPIRRGSSSESLGIVIRPKTKSICGDGNCFYRSVAYLDENYGHEKDWRNIKEKLRAFIPRSKVAQKAKNTRLENGTVFDEIVSRLKNDGEWVSGPVINMTQEMYQRPIEIIDSQGRVINDVMKFNNNLTPWKIYHSGGVHYEPIIE